MIFFGKKKIARNSIQIVFERQFLFSKRTRNIWLGGGGGGVGSKRDVTVIEILKLGRFSIDDGDGSELA